MWVTIVFAVLYTVTTLVALLVASAIVVWALRTLRGSSGSPVHPHLEAYEARLTSLEREVESLRRHLHPRA